VIHKGRFEASLGRAFWRTGGRLDLGYGIDYTDQELNESSFSLPTGDVVDVGEPDRFTRQGVSLSYRQPLLKNRGGDLDRLAFDLQGYTAEQTELETAENQEDFLLDLGLRFLEWILLTEQKRIGADRLGLAEEELASTRRKLEGGVVEEVDLFRAKNAMLEAKRNLRLVEARWEAKRVELATQAQDPSVRGASPVYGLYDTLTLPAPDDAYRRLRTGSRILQQLERRAAQLERERASLYDEEKPELDLLAAGGLKDGAEDTEDAVGFDKPEATVALAYTVPLGNRTAIADIERNVLERHQVAERMDDTALLLETEVRSLLLQLEEREEVLALNREQIETAAQVTREELRLYEQGRNQLTFVLQSRDQEQVARLIYARNATEYHAFWLRYRALMDELMPARP
jgi:outer membrane protein TolC